MKILIVGADGMIGHAFWRYFSAHTDHETIGSIRSHRDVAAFENLPSGKVAITGLLDDDQVLDHLMEDNKPDFVINCAGATMHIDGGEDPLTALPANSLLPHRIHRASRQFGARFLHLSTDCVFDGAIGNYTEDTPVNAKTYYGLSKALGEVVNELDAVTIRTSPVGFELSSQRGLLAWFLEQSGTIKGFSNAWFSGLTNLQLAKAIEKHVLSNKQLSGLYHLPGPKISKYDLLIKFREHFGSKVEIVPDGKLILDRSLNGNKLSAQTGYIAPSWDVILQELIEFGSEYPASTITKPVHQRT